MKFNLRWTINAIRDLQAMDRKTGDRITKKVAWFACQSDPLHHAEPLLGIYKGIFRFRVGDYRVLFEKDDRGHLHILVVLRVKHRREVYRSL